MSQWVDGKRNDKGFTLIELVVVIAILGILASIAVPKFSNLIITSQIKADAATAQEIINAARMQEAETGEGVITGPAAEASEYIDEKYMDIPEPRSVKTEKGYETDFMIALGLEKDTGGKYLYNVYWIPSSKKYKTTQRAVEGRPFEIKEVGKD